MHKPPLIILAGFDARPGTLPPEGADKHPLVGAKALDLRLSGTPLIDVVVDRAARSGCFGPMYIAGPTRLYGERRGDAQVVDTEGSIGHNIRSALAVVRQQHPGEAVAFLTCDIVPDIGEMRAVMEEYATAEPIDYWVPLIRVPQDPAALGASAWKPRYRVLPEGASASISILPGHLLVVQPETCRLQLVLRGFDLAYRSRNRSILFRLFYIVGGVLGMLLAADARRLVRLRLPSRLVSTLWQACTLALRLRSGRSTPQGLASPVSIMLVRDEHRQRHPEQAGRFVLSPALSLAKDIDTEEEAAELCGDAAAKQQR